MQHVVEQRHRVGARRRIGDLHREQRRAGPCAADGGGGQRVAAGGPAVGDGLLADRAGLAVETGEGEAVRAGAVDADAAAERAGERRLAGVGRVVARVGIEVARRARRIAAGKTVVVDRSRSRAGGRQVGVDNLEGDYRCPLSPSPSVTVYVATAGTTGLVVAVSAVNEYEPSAFTLREPAPMSIACE